VHKSHFGLCTISCVRGKVPTRDMFLGLATSSFDVSKNMYGQGLIATGSTGMGAIGGATMGPAVSTSCCFHRIGCGLGIVGCGSTMVLVTPPRVIVVLFLLQQFIPIMIIVFCVVMTLR
jgi:hypothetical protein